MDITIHYHNYDSFTRFQWYIIDIYIYIYRLIYRGKPNEPSTSTSHFGISLTHPKNRSYTVQPINNENLCGERSLLGLPH